METMVIEEQQKFIFFKNKGYSFIVTQHICDSLEEFHEAEEDEEDQGMKPIFNKCGL